MLRVAAIRPEPAIAGTLAAGVALGLPMLAAPMSRIVPVPHTLPDTPAAFDGLLLGSANALRLGGPLPAGWRALPVHAVGARTAEAARAAGLQVASTGSGGLQRVLDVLAGQRLRLLHLAGEERVPLHPPPGIAVETIAVYRAQVLPMPEALRTEITQRGACVLLHSGAAARHFASECDRLALPRANVHLAALADRIAQAAGSGWAALEHPAAPDEAALLALAQRMCQKASNGPRDPGDNMGRGTQPL